MSDLYFHLDPFYYYFYDYSWYVDADKFCLDNVYCTGNEAKLSECMYLTVDVQDCTSGCDEAGVICTGEYHLM